MPYKPLGPCRIPSCSRRAVQHGLCAKHQSQRPPAKPRQSAAAMGYGHEWRKVRAEVLATHGIPEAEWPLWDVHHEPPYNPAVEPDHRKYTLVPMLHSQHSRKTRRDNKARRAGGVKSSGLGGL